MNVALIFPPLADATQPYSSLPALAGFLRSRSRHHVFLHDANLEFTKAALTRNAIEAATAFIADRLQSLEKDDNSDEAAQDHGILVNASLKAPIVANLIEQAVADLRREQTFRSLSALDHCKRVVSDAFEILGAAALPIGLGTASLSRACSSAAEITRLAGDKCNPFLPFLRSATIPHLTMLAPGAVGISITYRNQILAAVTLALEIRKALPGCPIIFGGHIATGWFEDLADCPEVFDWCDYLVAFEGETALEGLLSELENGGKDLRRVPNLAFLEHGRIQRTAVRIEDLNMLPPPDYSGLPLNEYLAPKPVFMLNTSRGCYWGKCTFCAVSPSMRSGFRTRRLDLVLQDIATLQDRHGAECISFGDDCVPLRTLEGLGRSLPQRGLSIAWQCEVRFERQLSSGLLKRIAAAGCRNLIFGLESYAPAVLVAMKKGTEVGTIRRVLTNCRRWGIAFNLQLFFGFPGETEDDARKTADFVAGELYGAATISYGPFRLLRNSSVAQQPEKFGITVAANPLPLAFDLLYRPAPKWPDDVMSALKKEILNRTQYRSLPLSIDAHTLLYLHTSGVTAMAEGYYATGSFRDEESHTAETAQAVGNLRYMAKPRQTMGMYKNLDGGDARRILLYDYDLDKIVELSLFAARLIADCLDRPRSVNEIVDAFYADGDKCDDAAHRPETEEVVNRICYDLLQRGFVCHAGEASPKRKLEGC